MSAEAKLILIIDDAEENLEIVSAKLKHLGYKTDTAPNGETGIMKAQLLKPAVILLDLMLPKMDGWEVLAKLKSDPRTEKIPVVLMTAYTTIQYSGERQRAMKLGAADYIKKPFDLNEMAEMVARYSKS
jgi:CheY-like chemotaxis protein